VFIVKKDDYHYHGALIGGFNGTRPDLSFSRYLVVDMGLKSCCSRGVGRFNIFRYWFCLKSNVISTKRNRRTGCLDKLDKLIFGLNKRNRKNNEGDEQKNKI